MARDDEEVPYRSPIEVAEAEDVPQQDEEDFSTLKYLRKEFKRLMDELGSIDVFNLKDNEEGLSLKEQVAAYKKAKEILEPLYSLVDGRVAEIKGKQKGGK